MNKFLTTILRFAIFASLFYCCALFVFAVASKSNLGNLNYKQGRAHAYTRLRDVDQVADLDLLFVGSSHAYRGFDGRIFAKHGLSSFNLGTSSQTLVQSKFLLGRHLDRIHPKVVVLEVYPKMLMSDGVESSLDLLGNSKFDFGLLKLVVSSRNVRVFNTFLYAGFASLIGRAGRFSEPRVVKHDTYIDGGYVERPIGLLHPRQRDTFATQEIVVESNQLRALSEIIEMVESQGARIVLVMSPIKSDYYKSYLGMAAYQTLLSGLAEYYDFNTIIHLDDKSHYYDHHHLNQSGVEMFNEKLIKTLNL